MNAGHRPTRQPDPEDRAVRRTWLLLSGSFLLLTAITGFRALTAQDGLAWIPLAAVGVAALAAIAHRNAVIDLESRGRAEAESFARILRGLSRSVSADAIVGAIVDDLADATGADHVVVVRRRPDGTALDATLVTRRSGVPNSSTVLPLGDLDLPERHTGPVAVPIDDGADAHAPARVAAMASGVAVATTGERESLHSARSASPAAPAPAPAAVRRPLGGTAEHRRRTGWAGPAVVAVRASLAQLFLDLGIGRDARPAAAFARAEVLGRGAPAAAAARITDRVRAVYGLSHTLAAPLRRGDAVIGAIVLARRDREPWGPASRRLLAAAAIETATAFERTDLYRTAAANASTDPLTGLPNRRYFDEFCGLLARRRRAGDAVAVLMIDIDRFKVLNDTYGHPTGDVVLREVAKAIVSAVREEDVPARVGGEEFAVLLRNAGPDVAIEVGERVRSAVRELDLSDAGVPGVSVSVGVANALGADEAIPDIIGRADRALLRAKREGRDRVVWG